jgi:hypothetical protein
MKKKRNFSAMPFARVVAPRKKGVSSKGVPSKGGIPLNILFGLPDNQKASIKIAEDGRRLDYELPGTADIVPHRSKERFASEWIYLEPGRDHPPKLPPGAPIFQDIGERLDLDFFGVDCAIADTGDVLLFEANACMAILGQTEKELNPKAIAIDRIRDAVSDRVAAPATWGRSRARADVAHA